MPDIPTLRIKNNGRVAVVGAGVSGLAFTYFLSKLRPDLKFTIFEHSDKVGGYISSEYHDFYGEKILFEKGPRTLRGKADGCSMIVDTLLRLGDGDQVQIIPRDSAANKKYLLDPNNDLVQVPTDFNSFRNFIRSPLGKGLIPGVLTEIFKTKHVNEDESVESFLTRRFGEGLPKNIMSAVFHGIYAGNIAKLSAKTTLTSMFEAESKHGSIVKSMLVQAFAKDRNKQPDPLSSNLKDFETRFPSDYKLANIVKLLSKFPMVVIKNGLEQLPKCLYRQLQKNENVQFIFNDPTIAVSKNHNGLVTVLSETGINENFDHVRSTINANTLSIMLKNGNEDSATGAIAEKLKFINIFLVNIYIKRNLLKKNGFGYLIPKSHDNDERVLGVIFDSDIEKSSVKLFSSETLEQLKLASPKFPQYESRYDPKEYTKLTVMMGGHYWSKDRMPSVQTALYALKDALAAQLNIDLDALPKDELLMDPTMIPQCLPQYNVGYERLRTEFLTSLNEEFDGHFSVGGMSFSDGAGVPDCFANAFKNASLLA